MSPFLYPSHLGAHAHIGPFSIRSLLVLCPLALLSVFIWVRAGWSPPAVLVVILAVLCYRRQDLCLGQYMQRCFHYLCRPRTYLWQEVPYVPD